MSKNMSNCSVLGCKNQASRRGLCTKHYTRQRRYGNVYILRREHVGTDPDIPAPDVYNYSSQPNEATLNAEQLRNLLSYNPETGDFFWKIAGPGHSLTHKAGWVQSKKYWAIRINGKRFLAHRLAWLYVYGSWPRTNLDHKDRNGQNNAIHNLREADAATQGHNIKLKASNTSGVTGVAYAKRAGTWNAYITINKRRIHLGAFRNFDDAVMARKQAEQKYYG